MKSRPAELGSFFIIAPAVYGWLVSVDAPNVVAAVIGAIAGLVPFAISTYKDSQKADGDPGDLDSEDGPVVLTGPGEERGIDHGALPR